MGLDGQTMTDIARTFSRDTIIRTVVLKYDIREIKITRTNLHFFDQDFSFNPFRALCQDLIHVPRYYLNGKKTLGTMIIFNVIISQPLTMF